MADRVGHSDLSQFSRRAEIVLQVDFAIAVRDGDISRTDVCGWWSQSQKEVVRHVNCGIAVEFLSPLPADEFGENTTL